MPWVANRILPPLSRERALSSAPPRCWPSCWPHVGCHPRGGTSMIEQAPTETLQHVIVATQQGDVRGQRTGGIRRYLGVPYAAPPVNDLRFCAPRSSPSWTDIRDATEPGPNAPQFMRKFAALDAVPLVGTGWTRGDDYLTLNVWCPDDDSQRWPVMVFIHGGAFVVGSKDAAVSDGSGFARSGIVCVAI